MHYKITRLKSVKSTLWKLSQLSVHAIGLTNLTSWLVMNKLNFSIIWKIYMFTNATNKFWSLIMIGLADADGFEICIQDCILPGFRPLNTGISKCSSYLRLIVIFLLLYCFEWLVKWTKIDVLHVLIALFIEHDYHKTKDLFSFLRNLIFFFT